MTATLPPFVKRDVGQLMTYVAISCLGALRRGIGHQLRLEMWWMRDDRVRMLPRYNFVMLVVVTVVQYLDVLAKQMLA